jgi:hypothetical protein
VAAPLVLGLFGCPGELENAEELISGLGPQDAGPQDVGFVDMGSVDLGPQDAGGTDMATADPRCPDFVDLQTEFIAPTCGTAFCHDSDIPIAGLDLVSPGVAERVVDEPDRSENCTLVDSADIANSLMILSLEDAPPCSLRMPFGGQPLPDDEKACVEVWVEQLIQEAQ